MKNVSTTGLVVFAGLLAAPLAPTADHPPAATPSIDDPRLIRLQQYLESNDSPVHRFAEDFIEAADDNDLDWRLLPSIAIMESGGGKAYRNNNIFGWDNGNFRFSSIRACIHAVAGRLANSPLYRNKTVDEILRTFNPERSDYAIRVKSIMRQIARRELLNNTYN